MKQSYGRKTRFWMRKQDFVEKREACAGDIATRATNKLLHNT